MGGQQASYFKRAKRRSEIAVHAIRIIVGKRILIGRDDPTLRRIVEGRQLVERNEALPFVVARTSIHRNVAIVILPDGKFAGGMVADVAVHVGVNKVLARSGKSGDGGGELLPVAGAVDIQKRELE